MKNIIGWTTISHFQVSTETTVDFIFKCEALTRLILSCKFLFRLHFKKYLHNFLPLVTILSSKFLTIRCKKKGFKNFKHFIVESSTWIGFKNLELVK